MHTFFHSEGRNIPNNSAIDNVKPDLIIILFIYILSIFVLFNRLSTVFMLPLMNIIDNSVHLIQLF